MHCSFCGSEMVATSNKDILACPTCKMKYNAGLRQVSFSVDSPQSYIDSKECLYAINKYHPYIVMSPHPLFSEQFKASDVTFIHKSANYPDVNGCNFRFINFVKASDENWSDQHLIACNGYVSYKLSHVTEKLLLASSSYTHLPYLSIYNCDTSRYLWFVQTASEIDNGLGDDVTKAATFARKMFRADKGENDRISDEYMALCAGTLQLAENNFSVSYTRGSSKAFDGIIKARAQRVNEAVPITGAYDEVINRYKDLYYSRSGISPSSNSTIVDEIFYKFGRAYPDTHFYCIDTSNYCLLSLYSEENGIAKHFNDCRLFSNMDESMSFMYKEMKKLDFMDKLIERLGTVYKPNYDAVLTQYPKAVEAWMTINDPSKFV